jgi:hypothetical protein
MILLTDLLSTQDFVHLTMSCKYYYHDLWGAVSQSVAGSDFLAFSHSPIRTIPFGLACVDPLEVQVRF